MSMAFVLEGVRDYLRTQNSWDKHQCQIQQNAVPTEVPNVAPQWYVAIDGGPVTTSNPNNEYLGEEFALTAGVWWRIGAYAPDQRGVMELKTDIYRAGIDTLDKLERKAIKFLHHEWALLTAINTQFSLPDADLGDAFQSALSYTGRGPNEAVVLQNQEAPAFMGRRLNFKGLLRIQYVQSIG